MRSSTDTRTFTPILRCSRSRRREASRSHQEINQPWTSSSLSLLPNDLRLVFLTSMDLSIQINNEVRLWLVFESNKGSIHPLPAVRMSIDDRFDSMLLRMNV